MGIRSLFTTVEGQWKKFLDRLLDSDAATVVVWVFMTNCDI